MANMLFSVKTKYRFEHGDESPTFLNDNCNCLIGNNIHNRAGLEVMPGSEQWSIWTTRTKSNGM